jgi:hypothetical protein
MHIALGWEYRGRKVKQGAVVYLVLEGTPALRRGPQLGVNATAT